MKTRPLFAILILLLMLSCQVTGAVPPTAAPAVATESTSPAQTRPSDQPTTPPISPTPAPTIPAGPALPPFTSNTGAAFASQTTLTKVKVPASAPSDYTLPLDLSQVTNPEVIANLTPQQKALLAQNGFVVLHTQEAQFSDIRKAVAMQLGQPYYLTTDAAYHAMHQAFDALLKALEREQLRPLIIQVVTAALNQVTGTYLPAAAGTSIESDVHLSAAYLAVALRLLDPAASLDPALASQVAPQIDQVMAGAGLDYSRLFPTFKDDYGAYKPVGHYAGDPDLESYFRGLTWLGRVNFMFQNPEDPAFKPSHLPLIVTLALRQAQLEDTSPASAAWSKMHEMLTFLIGPSDDPGPLELSALMDQVYTPQVTIQSLADDTLWAQFLQQIAALPSPQINSTFVASLESLPAQKTWRFMGQRFVLDAYILQNLLFDKVGTMDNQRLKPSGLDVMAALGSLPALQALQDAGETSYANYTTQMTKLQQAVQAQPEAEWLNRFYSAWLYAFFPQLTAKTSPFPAYMRTTAWGYKDLNSALGSWAELKHDTALYTKAPEPGAGGGPPASPPPDNLIEPNPDVFYRLSYLAQVIYDGLSERGIVPGDTYSSYSDTSPAGLGPMLAGMNSLAAQFQSLGDLATKELRGEPLTEDERWVLQYNLGPIESMIAMSELMGVPQEMPPLPLVSGVSGAGPNDVLEAATGYVDRIYVAALDNGKLQVTQGGVFSYYEFTRPRDSRLTDEEWKQVLASQPPAQPAFVSQFMLPGGSPNNVMVFRVGDYYIITQAGSDLRVRDKPSRNGAVLGKFMAGDYITLIDGPITADGYTWWKAQMSYGELAGWVAGVPEWFERAYGQ